MKKRDLIKAVDKIIKVQFDLEIYDSYSKASYNIDKTSLEHYEIKTQIKNYFIELYLKNEIDVLRKIKGILQEGLDLHYGFLKDNCFNSIITFKNPGFIKLKAELKDRELIEILEIKVSLLAELIEELNKYLGAPNQSNEIKAKIKFTVKQYALAYIFDCNSIGESLVYGSKKELEKIGKNRNIGDFAPNTFYKAVRNTLKDYKDLNIETNLVEIAGEDWKAVLFELSKYPEELKKYLQSKKL